MVVRDKSAIYDPFHSINALMDGLELEARRVDQMVNEPWKTYNQGRKPSPIEIPRAGSSNSQNIQRRTTPPDNQHRQITPPQNQHRQTTPPQNQHRQTTPPQNQYRRLTPPENLFAPMPNRADPPAFRPNANRPLQRETIQANQLPKLKPFFSEPMIFGRPELKAKKKHRKVEDLSTVCGMLRYFREHTYKGSLRETQYRLQRVEEAQRMSSRIPTSYGSRMSCF